MTDRYLPDTNVWLALALSQHSHHTHASSWLDAVPDSDTVMFCRATHQSVLRLLSSTAVLAPYGRAALSNDEAWNTCQTFVTDDDRIVRASSEPAGLEDQWREYGCRDSASPKLWMDAYLAAYAKQGDCVLVTSDKAFNQFDGLKLAMISGG